MNNPFGKSIYLAFFTLLASSAHSQSMKVTGTLVAFVPTQGGLIVAADSRTQINLDHQKAANLIQCNDTIKIASVRKRRTVVSVANNDKIYFNLPSGIANGCQFLKSYPPSIYFTKIAKDYLDAYHGEIDEKAVDGLQNLLVNTSLQAQKSHPGQLFDRKTTQYITLGLGTYVPSQKMSFVATFGVCLSDPSAKPKICDSQIYRFLPSSARTIPIIGDGDFVTKVVMNGRGRQILTEESGHMRAYSAYMNHVTVNEISHQEALLAGVDLIESSAVVSEQIGDKGIGGPIHAVLLDEQHSEPFKLQ